MSQLSGVQFTVGEGTANLSVHVKDRIGSVVIWPLAKMSKDLALI